jgi:ubiquinone/menaquinone biosynthesis C-methylase UbiE
MSPNARPTSNYDPVSEHYDATRNLPEALLQALYGRVEADTALAPPARVLDAGCGTGQLSMPLVVRGYRVMGVDVSEQMLQRARAKVPPAGDATFLAEDVRALPFDTASFDAVVVSKLFQHVGGWTDAVDELRRVTAPGGLFLHINEKGAFTNAVRSTFSLLAKADGFGSSYPGFLDRTELPRYLAASGARRVDVDVSDLSWTKEISYRDALANLRLRLHSEYWSIPGDRYEELLRETATWIDEQSGGSDTVEVLTPHLTAEIFRWPTPAEE